MSRRGRVSDGLIEDNMPLRNKLHGILHDRQNSRRRHRDENEHRGSSRKKQQKVRQVMSGEDCDPQFDITKTMLRAGYNSRSLSKAEDREERVSTKSSATSSSWVSQTSIREEDEGEEGEGEIVVKCNNDNGTTSGPRFKDFGGIDKELQQLEKEVLRPLRYPRLLDWLGVKPVTGILLHGPPGCGKTRLAHAISFETGFRLFALSAPELVSCVSGASENNIRQLFSDAYNASPSIIFIDEFDAIASKREHLQKEMEQRIVTQLLTCMDDFQRRRANPRIAENSDPENAEVSGYVLVVGATNRPDAIDPAFRRPGRFDKELRLPVPDENARADILSLLARNMKAASDFDARELARKTPGFVGADLEHLCHKAGVLAVDRIIHQVGAELVHGEAENAQESHELIEKQSIKMADFEEAVKLVQPSLKREGFSERPDLRLVDVGGLITVREELEYNLIMRIKFPEIYKKAGMQNESGFLLYGPPGCGKTLIAKAVAGEAGANFIHIEGPELLSKYVGESESYIRSLFEHARNATPCIIFFDEIDALTTQRGKEGGWIVERLVTQLLVELNGGKNRAGVYVIGATNRPEVIDHALLRHGRFGKQLYVPLPSPEDRGLILKALARKRQVGASLDLLALGKSNMCENFSGADLTKLIDEAGSALLHEVLYAYKEELASGQFVSNFDAFTVKYPDAFTIKYLHFEQAFRKVTPSVTEKQRRHYEEMKRRFEAA